ncbi:MAG: hypothetical protein K6G65_02595 [Lachnospiraceae bacterium]|nr:hypothetical protein [Lachnospiraceae bacterium]
MDEYIKVLVVVLVINTVIAFVEMCYQIYKGEKQKGITWAIIIFFCPVIAPLFYLLIRLFYFPMDYFMHDSMDISDLVGGKKIKVITAADIRQESNKVPIEETLIISDKHSRRNAFLDVLKTDVSGSIDIVKMAIEDQDSEISHYAAAFLSETIADFKRQEKLLSEELEDSADVAALQNYVSYVGNFLLQNVMNKQEQGRYSDLLDKRLWQLAESVDGVLSGEQLKTIVQIWEKQDSGEKAEKWIAYASANCQDDLEAIKVCMRYYFSNRQFEQFEKVMEDLKASSLVLDSEAVEWIRFYT